MSRTLGVGVSLCQCQCQCLGKGYLTLYSLQFNSGPATLKNGNFKCNISCTRKSVHFSLDKMPIADEKILILAFMPHTLEGLF